MKRYETDETYDTGKKPEASEELLPCPFTHVDKDFGHAAWVTNDENGLWFSGCACGYRGPVMATMEQAFRSHNELLDLRNYSQSQESQESLLDDAVYLLNLTDEDWTEEVELQWRRFMEKYNRNRNIREGWRR